MKMIQQCCLETVVGMIKDLVTKLKEEAAAGAEHKQWRCFTKDEVSCVKGKDVS